MAIFTAEQINAILNGAPAVDPNVIWRQMGGAAYYGEVADATYANMWYTYENMPSVYRELYLNPYLEAWQAGGGSVTPTATEVLLPQASVNAQTGIVEGTTVARMPATSTPVGNVKAGALGGRLPIGTLVGGVAIGTGIGIKEVAQHRQFWEDVGDAVLKDIQRDPSAGVNPLCLTETANVLWRCLEDGSIQAYCDKRDIDAVVNRLYQFDAYNVADHLDPEVTTGGQQHIDVNPINSGYMYEIAQQAGYGSYPNVGAVYQASISRYPQTTVMELGITPNGTDYISVTCKCYNLESGIYNVVMSGSVPEVSIPESSKIGTVLANIRRDTGAVENISYSDGYVAGTTIRTGVNISTGALGNTGVTSNLGTLLIPKNPNVIYNGTDQLPPSDQSDFWTTFASWLANGFTVNPYNPVTNAYEPVTYVPFTAPDINWQNDPITGDQTDVWRGLYQFVDPFTSPTTTPVNNPSPWIFESIGNFTIPHVDIPTNTPWDNNPKFPNPTPNPIGSSPTLVAPSSGVSSGSRLFSVYNPSQANIDSLGAYLWNSSIIDQICKFFSNNPLDAVISLHMVYCTPTTGSNKNIYLGYLDSGVSAPVVTSQYETIACGDVDVPELYGNALDYDGVTVQAFLPFIGWRTLRTKEVMGKRVRVTYHIDVYTGTCLAQISVISAGSDQLLYTFEGNCSVQIPLTASDRTRLISGLITAGVSAYTGNPAGVVGGIASIKQDVDRSGSFSGNAGAMGIKKPYLVISRALNAQASNYNSLYGYPLNKSGVLKNFRGFTRVQSVHVDIPKATDYEKKLISDLLRNGVII